MEPTTSVIVQSGSDSGATEIAGGSSNSVSSNGTDGNDTGDNSGGTIGGNSGGNSGGDGGSNNHARSSSNNDDNNMSGSSINANSNANINANSNADNHSSNDDTNDNDGGDNGGDNGDGNKNGNSNSSNDNVDDAPAGKIRKGHSNNDERKALIDGIKADMDRVLSEEYGLQLRWRQINPNQTRFEAKTADPNIASSSSSSTTKRREITVVVELSASLMSIGGVEYMKYFDTKKNAWKFPVGALREWGRLWDDGHLRITVSRLDGGTLVRRPAGGPSFSPSSPSSSPSLSSDNDSDGSGSDQEDAEEQRSPSPPSSNRRPGEEEEDDEALDAIMETLSPSPASGSRTAIAARKGAPADSGSEEPKQATTPKNKKRIRAGEDDEGGSNARPSKIERVAHPEDLVRGAVPFAARFPTAAASDGHVGPQRQLTPFPATSARTATPAGGNAVNQQTMDFVRHAEVFVAEQFEEVQAIRENINVMLDSKVQQLRQFEDRLAQFKSSFGL